MSLVLPQDQVIISRDYDLIRVVEISLTNADQWTPMAWRYMFV